MNYSRLVDTRFPVQIELENVRITNGVEQNITFILEFNLNDRYTLRWLVGPTKKFY